MFEDKDDQWDKIHRVVHRIVHRYGIKVDFNELPKPNTGTFDGSEITIQRDLDFETTLFVLLHLFGHTVQWCTEPKYRTIDSRAKPGASVKALQEALRYERDATRLGMSLLHECGNYSRDQWLSDWWASDWNYLSVYYATGKLPEWKNFRTVGHGLLTPLMILEFTPQKFEPRYAF